MLSDLPSSFPADTLDLCRCAIDAARSAGALAEAIRKHGLKSSLKPDGTIVTNADKECENLITRDLEPFYRVIGEESFTPPASDSFLKTLNSAPYWLIDPIDGTRGFAAGNDHYCVNIALIENGAPILGVVRIPSSDETFLGVRGYGAWKSSTHGWTPVRTTKWDKKLRVLTSSRHSDVRALKTRLGRYGIKSLSAIGSAIKLVRIAEGRADYHLRLGPTMKWDTAAPQIILEEAGGRISDLDGAPLNYTVADWQNPHFEALGRPHDLSTVSKTEI